MLRPTTTAPLNKMRFHFTYVHRAFIYSFFVVHYYFLMEFRTVKKSDLITILVNKFKPSTNDCNEKENERSEKSLSHKEATKQ